jgi:hypothetical protein
VTNLPNHIKQPANYSLSLQRNLETAKEGIGESNKPFPFPQKLILLQDLKILKLQTDDICLGL